MQTWAGFFLIALSIPGTAFSQSWSTSADIRVGFETEFVRDTTNDSPNDKGARTYPACSEQSNYEHLVGETVFEIPSSAEGLAQTLFENIEQNLAKRSRLETVKPEVINASFASDLERHRRAGLTDRTPISGSGTPDLSAQDWIPVKRFEGVRLLGFSKGETFLDFHRILAKRKNGSFVIRQEILTAGEPFRGSLTRPEKAAVFEIQWQELKPGISEVRIAFQGEVCDRALEGIAKRVPKNGAPGYDLRGGSFDNARRSLERRITQRLLDLKGLVIEGSRKIQRRPQFPAPIGLQEAHHTRGGN